MATNLPPETRVPALPDPNRDPDGFMRAVKEILEVREGVRGNQLDREVTFRDLVDVGLAAPVRGIAGRGRQPGSAILTPVGQGGAGGAVGTGVKPIMTVPPKPRDVTAVGTFASILLAWGEPDYANHAYAEVLRADVDDIGQAVLVGTSIGGQYADPVGETANKYYWIRFVSTSNVKGPASTVVNGKTALNPAFVMANLLATTWQPNTTYSQFQYVRPTVDNGMMYRAVQDGVSGATEPTWPTTVGQRRTDGSTRWIAVPASERAPFIIGTVNGQPAVVMDTAYIGDATITTAKIKEAFLDNLTAIHGTLNFARIEKGQIFELAIGGEIKSATFSPLNNTGFIIRNEPGRDPDSPGLRQYTAEFYGDTLFSGDVRAARVLGGMLVGSVFGVPTDADNGSFEFIAIREAISDIVYGDRSDTTLVTSMKTVSFNGVSHEYECGNFWADPTGTTTAAYGMSPFAGFSLDSPAIYQASGLPIEGSDYFIFGGKRISKNGHPPKVQIPMLAAYYNRARLVTNPLSIISYNAVGPFSYRRYRRLNVPLLVTITRDGFCFYPRAVFFPSTPEPFDVLRLDFMSGTKRVAALDFGTRSPSGDFAFGYAQGNAAVARSLSFYAPDSVVSINDGDASFRWPRRYKINNEFIDAEIFIKDTAMDNGQITIGRRKVLSGSYVLLKKVPFSNPQPHGIRLEVEGNTRANGMSGLDIGLSMSTAMDNNI